MKAKVEIEVKTLVKFEFTIYGIVAWFRYVEDAIAHKADKRFSKDHTLQTRIRKDGEEGFQYGREYIEKKTINN
ncbi:hypothetical protein N8508_00425 [bacterium]|nr:hypothetical protein [bacterium]